MLTNYNGTTITYDAIGNPKNWRDGITNVTWNGRQLNSLVGVFRTAEEFRKYANEHWDGFKCPRCGSVSHDPQECIHRVNKDGKCDWTAYGLFRGPTTVIVLEIGMSAIPIFDPVAK